MTKQYYLDTNVQIVSNTFINFLILLYSRNDKKIFKNT